MDTDLAFLNQTLSDFSGIIFEHPSKYSKNWREIRRGNFVVVVMFEFIQLSDRSLFTYLLTYLIIYLITELID